VCAPPLITTLPLAASSTRRWSRPANNFPAEAHLMTGPGLRNRSAPFPRVEQAIAGMGCFRGAAASSGAPIHDRGRLPAAPPNPPRRRVLGPQAIQAVCRVDQPDDYGPAPLLGKPTNEASPETTWRSTAPSPRARRRRPRRRPGTHSTKLDPRARQIDRDREAGHSSTQAISPAVPHPGANSCGLGSRASCPVSVTTAEPFQNRTPLTM
jgi:hypothetical protein